MNDIKLIKTENGFDWNFTNGDMDNVIGDQQIISAVIHTISLRKHELQQLYYKDKGNDILQYRGELNNDNLKELLKADIEYTCQTVEGVFDAEVTLSQSAKTISIQKIQITKENGGVLNIGI